MKQSLSGLKKAQQLASLEQTLIEPQAGRGSQTLERDELWSFVGRKSNKVWIWLALCRQTRQIVGYATGSRDEDTCRKLWQSIPAQYRRGRVYSDFWAAYGGVKRCTSESHAFVVRLITAASFVIRLITAASLE